MQPTSMNSAATIPVPDIDIDEPVAVIPVASVATFASASPANSPANR